MSGVFNGERFEVPGVPIISWLDDPRALKTAKTNPRTQRISMIVSHVTSGTPTVVTPGAGPASTNPFYYSSDAALNTRTDNPSWDATIRRDGVVLWHNDPATAFTWHAMSVNPRSIGIEMETSADGKIYQIQIDHFVKLAQALTRMAGIQEQIPWYNGAPDRRVIPRIAAGGQDVTGVVGHRNQTDQKSDPGDPVFQALAAAGFEKFDLVAGTDKQTWAARQSAIGLTPDGIPGPATTARLRAEGYSDGIWVAGQGTSLLTWAVLLIVGSVGAYGLWRAVHNG